MKKLIKVFIAIILGIYILAFTEAEGNSIAMIVLTIAALDRLAAFADRKVPDSDPRKYT